MLIVVVVERDKWKRLGGSMKHWNENILNERENHKLSSSNQIVVEERPNSFLFTFYEIWSDRVRMCKAEKKEKRREITDHVVCSFALLATSIVFDLILILCS